MDIACPSCGEPWSAHHMRHDEPYEWGLSDYAVSELLKAGGFKSKDDPTLRLAESFGWRFATRSLLSFTQCPACPTEQGVLAAALTHRQLRVDAVTVLSELLAGDDDALASELSGL